MKLTEKQKECLYCHFEQGELGLELTTHDGNKANLFKNSDGYYLGVWNTHHHKFIEETIIKRYNMFFFAFGNYFSLGDGTPFNF